MPKPLTQTFDEIDLFSVVDSAIEEAKRFRELRGCTMSRYGGSVMASIDSVAIQSALVNLIINSAEAKKRCHIEIEVGETADSVFMTVHDDGPGIAASNRKSVFLPHVTSKEYNQGMGLVAVDSIVHLHRGRIEILDSHLGGAGVRLVLPKTI